MSSEPADYKRLFTVEEANAALPYVRAIVRDLANLSREVIERRQRLNELLSRKEGRRGQLHGEELTQIEEELEKDSQRLEEFISELRDIGVEPKNGPAGLVDFPCEMDGRVVYLCWKLDEPEVAFWHEIEAGFAGRQTLMAGQVDRSDEA